MPVYEEIRINIVGDMTGLQQTVNNAQRVVTSMGQNVSASNAKLVKSTQAMEKHVSASYSQMTRMAHMFQSALFYMAGHAVVRAVSNFFNTVVREGLQFNAMMQQNTIALETMLHSSERAKVLLEEVWYIAAKTPFHFKELAEITKTLVAFQMEAEKIPEFLWAVSDASAALGGGVEKAQNIALAFSKMLSLGVIQLREIRTLGRNGINEIQALMEYLGKTEREIYEMIQKKAISSYQAIDAFVKYAESRYGDMAMKMALKYQGLISTLKDYWERMMGDMTLGIFALVEEALPGLIERVDEFSNILNYHRDEIIEWWRDLYSAIKVVSVSIGQIAGPILGGFFSALARFLQGLLDFINNNKEMVKIMLTTLTVLGAIALAWKILVPLINMNSLALQGLAVTTKACSLGVHALQVGLYSIISTVAIATGVIFALTAAFTALVTASHQAGFSLEETLKSNKDVIKGYEAQTYLMEKFKLSSEEAQKVIDLYPVKQALLANKAKDLLKEPLAITIMLKSKLDELSVALYGVGKAVDAASDAMWNYNEEAQKMLGTIESELYALTHTEYEVELKKLQDERDSRMDILHEGIINSWLSANEQELDILKVYNLKKAKLDAEYATKKTTGYAAALAEYKRHVAELLKLQETLEKDLYNLTHSSRAVQTKELERERDERLKIAEDNATLIEQIEAIHQLKMKALRDDWAKEDLEKQQDFLDKKKKAQEEYIKFEIESANRAYEYNKAQMEKTSALLADFRDKQTRMNLQGEALFIYDLDKDLEKYYGSIPAEELKAYRDQAILKYREEQAQANYTSLLQMQKDMEEFLKDFDMEKFKANAQKVIDLSLEAAKFISTLTINLDPAVAEKLKEINKTFNEVTIGNLTEMIKSFTEFGKIVAEYVYIPLSLNDFKKLMDYMLDMLLIFTQAYKETLKDWEGSGILDTVREINLFWKDSSIAEFTATMKSFFEFGKTVSEFKPTEISIYTFEKVMDNLLNIMVVFTQAYKKVLKDWEGSGVLDRIREINTFFKDSAITEFTSTLKSMFDLVSFINELEYKPVSEAKLDSMLTYLTEFMVLLANRTKEWVEALKKDSLLESMRALNETFKDTNLNEFIGTIKSVFELVKLFAEAPQYDPSTIVNNVVDFLINLEAFVIALDNALISIGKARLEDIASRTRTTFGTLNTLFKDISLDEFMKMVKSLDELLERFTPKFDEQGKQVADLLSDVANVASRIKWFFTQLNELAKALEKMFSGESGKYLEAVSGRVKAAFDKLNNAFKDITLVDFTNFMTMLKSFEESVMKDKNGRIMTSIDIDKVKEAIIGMLTALEDLSKDLDKVMNGNSKDSVSIAGKKSWIDTLKERLENTIGKVAEIMQYAVEKMMSIRNSWGLITGTVTDMKSLYLSTILECITGLSELLDSPLWKGIIDKVENVYLKVSEKLLGIQTGFTNMRVSVEETINTLAKNLTTEFNGVIDAIGNAEGLIGDKLTNLGNTITESKAVDNINKLVSEINNLTKGMDNMVLRIGTWIVAFTKFCFTIAYLATLAFRAVEQFNLEMEKMLNMASAFRAFVMEIKPLMEEMIKLFGTWAELMTTYGDWVDRLTKSGSTEAAFWKEENFGTDPWDWGNQNFPGGNTADTEVGAGGWYDDQGNYHKPESLNPPIIINGDLVLQGVQNPQQLVDELKRMGNMRGAVNVNYNY